MSAFQKYYQHLYAQPHLEKENQTKCFLKYLKLLMLSTGQSKHLIAEITEEEVNKAIYRLKANKSPGPEGYPSEWYKTFKSELIPTLLNTFNAALKDGKIPPTWREATISVIPKEGKDRLECGSYRPISVLNTDCKLYTSILAKRLEKILPQIVNTDQTGFMAETNP